MHAQAVRSGRRDLVRWLLNLKVGEVDAQNKVRVFLSDGGVWTPVIKKLRMNINSKMMSSKLQMIFND